MFSIENLLENLKGVSRLTEHDADLFLTFFKEEPICYANSWLYTLRSTRNDLGQPGYKFAKQDVLLGLGCRNKTVYLTHPLGKNKCDAVRNLCSEIAPLIEYPIVLKKLDADLYLQLKTTKYLSTSTSKRGIFEEEAFPEKILNLSNMFDSNLGLSSKLSKLARKIKRFEQLEVQLSCKFSFTEKEVEEAVKSSGVFNYDKYVCYRSMIQQVISSEFDVKRYKVCAFYDCAANKMHGLYIGELLGRHEIGLYCSLTSKALPGITEFMDVQFLKHIFSSGIKTVYLGGSETEGVYNYVQKLLPDTPLYSMLPLIY